MTEIIKKSTHSQGALLYALSRMLERASYYGLRSIIILYMIGDSIKMDTTEALRIYGFLATALIVSEIIGGVLGDLVIGNKKSIIIGSIIQAIGAFSFCIPTTTGIYMGLFLVVLGSGFYSPNIIANFGKLYLTKTKLLDAGFTLLYLAINIGTFLGILLIGYFGEKHDWSIGFIIAGILSICSIIPILISKEEIPKKVTTESFFISKRILNILIAILLITLFWTIYEIPGYHANEIQQSLIEISTLNIPKSIFYGLNALFIIPISIIAIIVWTRLYSSHFFKMMLGFIFGAIAFKMLLLIPETPTEDSITIYFTFIFFLSLSEIHIAPIILSVLTKFTNPKYLAILISIIFIPTRILSIVIGLFNDVFYDNPILGINIGIVTMSILSVGLLILLLIKKKISKINTYI